jgi:hypothetical protein
MKRQTVMAKKRRGPPPTGKGALIGVRMQPFELAQLDSWIANDGRGFTRPQAIRQMVELGLTIRTYKPKQAAAARAERAKELASKAIDSLTVGATDSDEKAIRKRRLIKGPEEFREMRVDRAKPK